MKESDAFPLRRILFATDFSSGASRAREYAVFLAKTYGAALRLLHVSQPYPTLSADAVADPYLLEPIREQVSRVLNELADHVGRTGVQASVLHTTGIGSEEIVRVAEEEDADIIVMGTQGRTGLDHVLLGSTAERVVKSAPCPVLTARASSLAEGGPRIPGLRRLLVPFDFFQSSLDALETALHLAERFGASITLLHVLEWAWLRLQFSVTELAEDIHVRKDIEARLQHYINLLRARGITVETAIQGGAGPADHIVETAEQRQIDLIVIGTHGKRGIQRALIGSVAEGVLRRAPCAVLTMKTARFAPGYRRMLGQTQRAA